MSNRSRFPTWSALVAVPFIVLSAIGIIFYLFEHTFWHLEAETSVTRMWEEASRLNALEWQAVATKKVDPELFDEVNQLRYRMDQTISETAAAHIDEYASTRLRQTFDTYMSDVDRELRLISTGNLDEAELLTEKQSDPAYSNLSEAIALSKSQHHEIAAQQGFRAYLGSALTAIFSLALIGFLLLRYERMRHAAEVIQAEKNILKATEEQILNQTNALQARNKELEMLYEVSSTISRTIVIDRLFADIMDSIAGLDFLSVERQGGIFTVEEDQMKLAYYLEGHSEEFLKLHDGMKVGECLCGLAAKTGEIIISKNSGADSRHTITYPDIVTHGHIIIPLKAIDKTVGVLYLYLPPDFEIDDEVMKTLTSIGNQMGIALENARLYEETKLLSLHDPLTGLANRRLMHIELDRNLAVAKRLNRPFSVLMLDLDFFKNYNDSHGHTAGDRLLVEISQLLTREMREMDLVARFGGEEFLMILPETGTSEATDIAERIRRRVMETDFYYSGDEPPEQVTVSLGVASFIDSITSERELITMADKAMYEAKNRGRNRVEVWKT